MTTTGTRRPRPRRSLEHVESPLARQAEVEEDDVVRLSGQGQAGFPTVPDPVHGVPRLAESALDGVPEHRIVLDQKDAHPAIIIEGAGQIGSPLVHGHVRG